MKKKTEKQVVGLFFIVLLIFMTFMIVSKYNNPKITGITENDRKIIVSKESNKELSGVLLTGISNIKVQPKGNIGSTEKEIPVQFQACKNDTDKISCIISIDTKTGETDIMNLLNKQFVSQRLDEIDSFKDVLGIPQDKAEKSFASIFQDIYILRKPELIFEIFECKTEFCKSVITDTKRLMLGNIKNTGLIEKIADCKKIPEQEIKNSCENLFN